MKYRLIDHTADFGIHVFGSDLKDLFAGAACAMFDQITVIDELKGVKESIIEIAGADWPDLMVNWLRELLYLWTGEEKLVKEGDMISISQYKLTADVQFEQFDPERHVIKGEIKAVTYHQIQVYKEDKGWEAKIIFDV